MGPLPRSAATIASEWRTTQRHPGDCLRVQNETVTREADPRPRVHCPSRTFPQVVVHPVCHA